MVGTNSGNKALVVYSVLPNRSVFDFTDGLSNAELDFLHVIAAEQLQISPHRRPHFLFLGKYSLICSYPVLSLSLSK